MGKWEKKELGEITNVVGGGTPKTAIPEYWNGDIIWLSPVDLPPIGVISKVNNSAKKITQLGLDKSSAKLLPKGTVVYSSRASIGKIGITENEICTNQGFTNFICEDKVYNYFLAYALKNFNKKIEELSNSTTFKEVSKSAIKKFKIPLPPLNTQKQIVSKLDALFARIDKSIGLLEGNIQHTKDLMASVLDGEFGKLGEKFGKKALNDICVKITDGSHHSPKAIEKGYPYVTVKDINNKGEIDLINCKKISEMDYAELLKTGCQPQKGDVLLSKDGTVGKVAIVDFEKDWVVLSSLAIIRPNVDILKSEYLSLMLQTPIFQKTAIGLKTGAAIKRIVLRTIKTMEIPAPNLKEQEKAIVKIHDLRKPLNNLITQQSEKLKHLQSLKSSLLDMAFKGDLV